MGCSARVLTRLKDAENEALSLDGRFDLAYNAAHALSLCSTARTGNVVEYEGVADIDAQFVAAVLRVTRDVAARVQKLGPVKEG